MNEFRIEIKDGKVEVFCETGSFETAGPAVSALFALMKEGGIELVNETPPEQHRHDDEKVDRLLANNPLHSHGGHSHQH